MPLPSFHKAGMKAAERMVAAGWYKGIQRNAGLLMNIPDQLIQRIARVLFIPYPAGMPSEVRNRLEMNPPHDRNMLYGESGQCTDFPVIDTGNDGGYQRDPKTCTAAVIDAALFVRQKKIAAQRLIDAVMHAVELKKDVIQPCVGKLFCKGRILCQTNAVGIELHIGAAPFLCMCDQCWKILAHSGFAAGKLQRWPAASVRDIVNGRDKGFLCRICRCTFAAVGKTVAAVKIASVRDFQKNAAAVLLVRIAETAGRRTLHSFIFLHAFGAGSPCGKIDGTMPYRYRKCAVFGAFFD